jgi:hypothetical protein
MGSYLAEVLDVPIVNIQPAGPMHVMTSALGSPFNPAYQPVLTGKMIDPTVFTQRLGTFAVRLICFNS